MRMGAAAKTSSPVLSSEASGQGAPAPEAGGKLVPAAAGYGPLLQRDYWAVISRCRFRPSGLMALVARRFREFAPSELCLFRRADGSERSLHVGDVLDIDIRLSGHCQVRVLHRDRASLTLGTLQGHPEAGRITFGAYRNELGDVIFHIRSRARSSSGPLYAGFVALGEAMQTNTWTEFVNRVAVTAGDGVVSVVHAETCEIADETKGGRGTAAGGGSILTGPTFLAQGD